MDENAAIASVAKWAKLSLEGKATLTMYPLCTGSTHELLQLKGHKASGARRNIMPPQLLDHSLCDASSKTEQALRLARASELLQHAPGQPGYQFRTYVHVPPSPPPPPLHAVTQNSEGVVSTAVRLGSRRQPGRKAALMTRRGLCHVCASL